MHTLKKEKIVENDETFMNITDKIFYWNDPVYKLILYKNNWHWCFHSTWTHLHPKREYLHTCLYSHPYAIYHLHPLYQRGWHNHSYDVLSKKNDISNQPANNEEIPIILCSERDVNLAVIFNVVIQYDKNTNNKSSSLFHCNMIHKS